MSEKGGHSTRQREKKDAEMCDYNSIMVELRSHREEVKALIKSQIGEVNTSLDKTNTSLEKIEKQLDSNVKRLERLINENRDELKAELKTQIKQVQDNHDMDIGQLSARIDRVEVKMEEVKQTASKFNPDVSIIIVGLPFADGEDVAQRVATLLADGLQCDPVPALVNVERLIPRGQGSGIIKVEFRSVEEKVAVLRRKRSLRENEDFQHVYIHNAKSHAERLIEINFRTLLKELPCGRDYFFTGSGRLSRRAQTEAEGSETDRRSYPREARSPRGRGRWQWRDYQEENSDRSIHPRDAPSPRGRGNHDARDARSPRGRGGPWQRRNNPAM